MHSIVLSLFLVSSALAQAGAAPSSDDPQGRALVQQATDLVGRDRPAEAVALLRQAIALAPDSVAAHRQYVRTRAFFQGDLDAVKAGYDAGAARLYEANGYPTNLVIDRQGVLRYREGAFDSDGRELDLLLGKLLAE